MKKIGIPDDNMLLVNAGQIKASILKEKASFILYEHFYEVLNDRGLYVTVVHISLYITTFCSS